MKETFIVPKDHKLIRQDGETYTVQRPDGSCAVYAHNTEKSMTHQEFADECDINNLMKRYRYNQLPDVPTTIGSFSQVTDYKEMLEATIHTRNAFDLLPAHLRQRFGNDPQQIIDFLGDSNNRDEAVKLGLVNPKVEPTPDPILTELKTLNKNLASKEQK
jgi:phage internal scaffolding protein